MSTFRKDINGLRAIAVIAVVLFHFKPAWLSGGFAGVDVFFVISGFLMTGIISRGIEQDNFSILKFYVARANRIIPALAVLCLTLLVFGWFYLTPIDYKTLGKHAAGSIGFLSNVLYWRESGYFDASSLGKWLLHTWSLSVEWQFYIIYPLILISVRKLFSVQAIKPVILLGTLLGFALCVYATYRWPSAAYYLLPTRAWEMMIGGIAYLYPISTSSRQKRILELVGVTLIVGSYFTVSAETYWPGYIAIFPVLGSFLIIIAQRNDSLITSNIVFQKIGLWSYSIYLWHWPLVVAIYYFSLSSLYVYIGMLLSVFLGYLSYTHIEKINFNRSPKSVFHFKPLFFLLSIIGFGSFVNLTNGFEYRFSDEVRLKNKNALLASDDWDYPAPNLKVGNSDVRFIGGNSDKNILFIGASHTEQVYPYVKNFGSDYNVYFLTKGGCFLTPSYVHPKWSCDNIQSYKSLIDNVNFDRIVTSAYLVAGGLSDDEEKRGDEINTRVKEYDDFLKYAKDKSKEVFMILGEPIGQEFDPVASVRYDLNNFISVKDVREKYTVHENILARLKETSNVRVVDPINFLCDSEVCMTTDDKYNFYYKDSTHMRPWYAKKHLNYLDAILK